MKSKFIFNLSVLLFVRWIVFPIDCALANESLDNAFANSLSHLHEADDSMKQRDFNVARKKALEATNSDPKNAEAWLWLGGIDHIFIKDNEGEALRAFQNYLSLKPNSNKKNQVDAYIDEIVNEEKSPGAAFALSCLIPGGGQYYDDNIASGFWLTAIGVTGGIMMIVSSNPSIAYGFDPQTGNYDINQPYWSSNSQNVFYGGLCLVAASYITSMIIAPLEADDYNNRLLKTDLQSIKTTSLSLRPSFDLCQGKTTPTMNLVFDF